MRAYAWLFRSKPQRARITPALPAPADGLPLGAEPFEWPEDFGNRMPDIDAFVDWCGDVGIDGFQSIRSLRIAHDEFALLTGRQHVPDRKISRLVALADRIEKWRDRRHGNATRYRIIHRLQTSEPMQLAA